MADLATLAEAKDWLGIPSSNTDRDALLTRMLAAASGFIRTWCNRDFESKARSYLADGHGGARLVLPEMPVTAVASLSVDWQQVPVSPGGGQSGYVFDQHGITLMSPYRFTRGRSNVQVSYTGGDAAVPAEINQACLELLGIRFRELDRIGMVSKSLAGETIAFTQKDMPDSVKTILGNYKKVVPV